MLQDAPGIRTGTSSTFMPGIEWKGHALLLPNTDGRHVRATAILDRLIHHATTLYIGESYRLKDKRKAGLLGQAPKPQETETATAGE